MAANHATHEEVRNPGTFTVPGGVKGLFFAFVIIGVLSFGAGLKIDSQRAWTDFLHGHYFVYCLALGGLFFSVIQWLTGAMWSAPVRRIAESFTSYLPVAFVSFLILYFGMHELYHWTHEEAVAHDLVLQHKASYLNIPFFFIRNIIFFAVMILMSKKLIGNSLLQDTTKDAGLTARNRSWSPVFIILFAVGFTMNAIDSLMSLDPHWFSTMFGVYCFAGLFYSVLALITIVAVLLRRAGALSGIVTDDTLHDCGKFMFAFTVFWAYIAFSQFMLIWYANLPEETPYMIKRFENPWLYISIFLLVGKFLTPFFLLLTRAAKRSENSLLYVGIFMLIAQWVDLAWLIQPQFSAPRFGWMEIGITLGFVGLFGLAVSRFLGKNTIVAMGDPKLNQAVFHHHQ